MEGSTARSLAEQEAARCLTQLQAEGKNDGEPQRWSIGRPEKDMERLQESRDKS